MKLRKNKAQEEMVGFVLIMIIVAVILLVFLGFSLRGKREIIESYEVESFIQAMLQYTSECEDYTGFLNIKELIFECKKGKTCNDGTDSCEVLNSELNGIIEESWKAGEEAPVKAYSLGVTADEAELITIEQGNKTNNYKGAVQEFTEKSIKYKIKFNAYY